jgi:GH15 family glucan-1,4-alpha-glucosidase
LVRLEDLGLVGNCQYAALIARDGAVSWCCWPRFDSEPVFASLLDHEDGGRFVIAAADGQPGTQQYLSNTNVLETTFRTPEGSFRVLDFAPRFFELDRSYRPTMLVRIVEPLEGMPTIHVRCDPCLGWSKKKPARIEGSHQIDYEGFARPLRLTTDVPLSYLGGHPFTLTEKKHFVLTWGEPCDEPLASACDRYLHETTRYWRTWVKHCEVPPLFQEEVIRSALALKLHCFEDTGAIVASTTMAIPESPGSGRTWDYRYCWLRDSYYVLAAFRRLGHFEEREKFTSFLLDIAAGNPTLDLAPLYRIDGSSDLEESILTEWPGIGGEGPVRLGNGAALHQQHDVFGEMVLALAPIFLDDRFKEERSGATLDLVERLARKALAVVGSPDAGIWEYRTEWKPQTFSSLMCWAAADRMTSIAKRHRPGLTGEFAAAAEKVRAEMLANAWNPDVGAFVASYGGQALDASLLEMASLRFLRGTDERLRATIDAIGKTLLKDGWIFRYLMDDGFGCPTVAFVICTFWLIEALALIGRRNDAQALMHDVRKVMSPLGLLSEDFDPVERRMWGNFPQAYSHVGLIHAAFSASPRWGDID